MSEQEPTPIAPGISTLVGDDGRVQFDNTGRAALERMGFNPDNIFPDDLPTITTELSKHPPFWIP